jgi:hypothetical protein
MIVLMVLTRCTLYQAPTDPALVGIVTLLYHHSRYYCVSHMSFNHLIIMFDIMKSPYIQVFQCAKNISESGSVIILLRKILIVLV